MAKVRVHELAKAHDMSAQDVLEKLRKAGIKVKAPASAVDEDMAKAALEGRPLPSNGAAAKAEAKPAAPAAPRPTVRRAPPRPRRSRSTHLPLPPRLTWQPQRPCS
jgi:translation initiation factor IF-2